jgi:hypothetical protein
VRETELGPASAPAAAGATAPHGEGGRTTAVRDDLHLGLLGVLSLALLVGLHGNHLLSCLVGFSTLFFR